MNKSYTDLLKIDSFTKRLEYLKLDANVGLDTFGFDRYLNQIFYKTPEWIRVRNQVILRDTLEGYVCDLACPDRPIGGRILVHHLNPITKDDIVNRVGILFDPENLVCVSHGTHNFIHYGAEVPIPEAVTERRPNDTCPWKKP